MRLVQFETEEQRRCVTEYARTASPLLAARLATANMRLVVKIAHGYPGRLRDRDTAS